MDNRVKQTTGFDAATQAVMQSMRTQMGHSCPDATTARIYAREFAKAALAARASDTGRSEAEAKEAAAKACHDEQMTVWSGEVIGRLTEYLRDDLSYDDVLHANDAVAREIRGIVESAFCHPELASLALLNPPAGQGETP